MEAKNKIKTKEEIKEIIKLLRKNNPKIKIVTTNGAFDIIHIGHIKSINESKKYGDILIIGLNSDKSIKKYKSKDRPIIPENERAEILANLEKVDYVVLFDEPDPRNLLEVIKPNFHVKSESGFKGIEREIVEKNGGNIILIKDVSSHSTTKIINELKEFLSKEI